MGVTVSKFAPTLGPWRAEEDPDYPGVWLVYGCEREGRVVRRSQTPFVRVYNDFDAQVIVEALAFAKASFDGLGREVFAETPTLLDLLLRSNYKWTTR